MAIVWKRESLKTKVSNECLIDLRWTRERRKRTASLNRVECKNVQRIQRETLNTSQFCLVLAT